MGIRLYDIFNKTWGNYDPGINADPYIREKALVNILIELRVISNHLAMMNNGLITEDLDAMRNDIVQEYPIL